MSSYLRDTTLATATIKCYVEPALCFFLSLVFSPLDLSFAYWIRFAAIALFINEQILRNRLRTRQLDTLDSRAEAHEAAPRPRAERITFVEARPAPVPAMRANRAVQPPRPVNLPPRQPAGVQTPRVIILRPRQRPPGKT